MSLATHHPVRHQPSPTTVSFNHNNKTTASINRTKAARDQTVTIWQCFNFRSKTAKAAAALDGSRYRSSPVAQTTAGPAMLEHAGTTCLQGRSSGVWYDNTNEPTSVSFSKASLQNINNNQPRGILICKNGGVPNKNVPGVIVTTSAVWIASILALADSKTVITTNAQATCVSHNGKYLLPLATFMVRVLSLISFLPQLTLVEIDRCVKWSGILK
jgi:hypothetical protein